MIGEQFKRHRSLWQQVLIQTVLDDGPAAAAEWLATPWGRHVAEMAGFEAGWLIKCLAERPHTAFPRHRHELDRIVSVMFPTNAAAVRARRYRDRKKERDYEQHAAE